MMYPRRISVLCLLAAVTALAACGPRQPSLMQIQSSTRGPDEFAILPGKPIEIPEDLTALPPPSLPGTGSRTTPTPQADAVAALGGNPARLARDGQTPDTALVRQAGRFGTSPDIRVELGVADGEFRRRNRGLLLERWAGVTTYFDAYRPLSLNQHAEQERFRRAGARSSAAPPPPVE